MTSNFFKTACRNIRRHKGFSFLNISGLMLGLTACLLIGFFVWDEYQYDRFVPGGDEVYRLYVEYKNSDGSGKMAVTPPAFAATLKQDFSAVEQTARVMQLPEYKTLFEANNRKLYEQSGYFVDSTFFGVFPLSFKYGSSVHALDDPGAIVLSDEMAGRLFGKQDPVGHQLLMDKQPLLVKGVFITNPRFHLSFHYLRALSSVPVPRERMQSWTWNQFFTYVRVRKGTDVQALQTAFQKDAEQRSAPFRKDLDITNVPFFQSLRDIHLHAASFKFDAARRGNITYVRGLIVIALFIMLIACFNFINLATAQSLQRAKEVGIRKTLGAARRQLILQFIGETVFLTFISTILSVSCTSVLLPWLNRFTNKNIPSGLLTDPVVWCLLIALALIVGLLAGFYPALVLSRFRPVKVLKGPVPDNETQGRVPWLRYGLVVVQFSLSVLLIISAIVVYDQVNYLHNKDLGFNKDQIMFFPMRGDNMFKNVDAFKQKLMQTPGVASVSIGYGFPGDAVAGDQIIVPRNGQLESQSATQLAVDYNYIKTLGLQLVAGRGFSKEMATDKDHAWIINETAVKTLGFGTPEKALGQPLYWHVWGAPNPDSMKKGQVIGVVKDFNYKSLYDKVETTVLQIFPGAAWKVAVKIKASNTTATINQVRAIWSTFSPEYPIEYKFLDANFEELYRSEDKLRLLLTIFTATAVFVGCLGLFGLAAYMAERRRKEVGIRKVLGASTGRVVLLLSKDFIRLVMVSLMIASPVAWYCMNRWLQHFAYRISIGWPVFMVAAVTAIGIAFIAVSFQAVKAAIVNPIKSLRME